MITTRTPSSRAAPALTAIWSVTGAVVRAVATRWTIMVNRRRLKGLEELDDYLLADIGLTREDIRSALTLPGDTDPSLRLAAIIREREVAPRPSARRRGR